MLPAANKGAGMNFGFPDVCLTPVGPVIVPIPYPNFALNAQAAVFSPIVKVAMIPALNLASIIAMTFGDEAGVAHWTIKGIGAYILGNPIVYVDKLPAINLTCLTTGNNANNALGMVVVPSVTHVTYTYAGTELERAARGDRLSCGFLDEGVGLVRIDVFSADLPSLFFNAMRELNARGLRELVVDLRGNPGGDASAAVELASDFLEPGAVVVTELDADGDEIVHRARGGRIFDMPLVLLVDSGTASAAEIFAGSLAAHGRALLVGTRTYGKWTGQTVFEQGSATVARYVLPNGLAADGGGLLPDVAMPGGE